MASTLTNSGIKIIMDRAYASSVTFSRVTEFKIGQDQSTPEITDTDLDNPVPISDGTVNDDGNNQLTGSSGGDNTTDNTTTFKEGAGASDVTSQNLIANNGNATKIWTISNLATNGTNITQTSFFGLWFYINDAADLAKFKTSGTALEVKLGSAVGDYFSLTKEASDLAVGWNWISSNKTAVEDLTETGTVAGNVDTFIIEVITNNATDTFSAGDVLYDLLRTWIASDLTKTITSTTIDNTALTVEIRLDVASTQANGFLIDSSALFNTDSTVLVEGLETYTKESKSSTDQFIYTIKNQFQHG